MTADAPGWARRPDVEDHVVTCPTCGELMSWARYLEHGPTCGTGVEDGGGDG